MLLDYILFIGGVVVLLVVGVAIYNGVMHTETITPEMKAQTERDSYLRWHSSEVKYCTSQGLDLNTSYYLNGCEIVECKNITGLYTYKFCNQDNDGSMASGLLIGYLLFSR